DLVAARVLAERQRDIELLRHRRRWRRERTGRVQLERLVRRLVERDRRAELLRRRASARLGLVDELAQIVGRWRRGERAGRRWRLLGARLRRRRLDRNLAPFVDEHGLALRGGDRVVD